MARKETKLRQYIIPDAGQLGEVKVDNVHWDADFLSCHMQVPPGGPPALLITAMALVGVEKDTAIFHICRRTDTIPFSWEFVGSYEDVKSLQEPKPVLCLFFEEWEGDQ